MAVATHAEIESFIGKFVYLSSCGYATDLHFSAVNGTVKVNFQASLGSLPQPLPRNVKPSRLRRRQRRRENRNNSSNMSTTDAETTHIDTSNTLVQPESRQDNLGLDATGQVSALCNDAFSPVTNRCQIDAAVQTINDVQDSSCETDTQLSISDVTSSQMDPFLYSHGAHTVNPNFLSTSADTQQCSYCVKGFTNWNDFLEHMKLYNYMCNNCLDYVPEKPWFSTSKLVMLDVGSGDLLYLNVPHMTLP